MTCNYPSCMEENGPCSGPPDTINCVNGISRIMTRIHPPKVRKPILRKPWERDAGGR